MPKKSSVRIIAPERKNVVEQMYLAGATYGEMIAATGYAPGSIAYCVRHLPRRRDVPHPRYDEAFKIAAVGSVLAGMSMRKVALRLKIEQHTIASWVRSEKIVEKAKPLAQRVVAEFTAKAARERLEAERAEVARRAEIDANNAAILPTLPPRLRSIMEARIAGETCASIARRLGVSRERACQLDAKGRVAGIRLYKERRLTEARQRLASAHELRPHREPEANAPKRDVFAMAHEILEGRKQPVRLSEAERERRREHMRRVANEYWANRREAEAAA